MRQIAFLAFFVVGTVLAGSLPRTESVAGASAYIIRPAHGEVVSSPVHVVFGLRGMGIAPAGVERPGTGHHHLLIDTGLPDLTRPIPADDHHRHFGNGQTEALLEMEPGEHTLQLLLGDALHIPHDPAVTSRRITITVAD